MKVWAVIEVDRPPEAIYASERAANAHADRVMEDMHAGGSGGHPPRDKEFWRPSVVEYEVQNDADPAPTGPTHSRYTDKPIG